MCMHFTRSRFINSKSKDAHMLFTCCKCCKSYHFLVHFFFYYKLLNRNPTGNFFLQGIELISKQALCNPKPLNSSESLSPYMNLY